MPVPACDGPRPSCETCCDRGRIVCCGRGPWFPADCGCMSSGGYQACPDCPPTSDEVAAPEAA